jgi:hypothetical protein
MPPFTNPFENDVGWGNVWGDFFEEPYGQPGAGYFSALPQSQTPVQQRFYQNRYPDVYNQFLGEAGGQIRAGQLPTLRFGNFAQNFPYQQSFATTPPLLRGGPSLSRFAPRARSFFF